MELEDRMCFINMETVVEIADKYAVSEDEVRKIYDEYKPEIRAELARIPYLDGMVHLILPVLTFMKVDRHYAARE